MIRRQSASRAAAAAAAREALWRRINADGLTQDDPASWAGCHNARHGIAEVYDPEPNSPWADVVTPRLRAAGRAYVRPGASTRCLRAQAPSPAA